jgi:hypothetical protein
MAVTIAAVLSVGVAAIILYRRRHLEKNPATDS